MHHAFLLRTTLAACCFAAVCAGEASAQQHGRGAAFFNQPVSAALTNQASVSQHGSGNGAAIVQNGQANTAGIRQFGHENTGAITQSGDNNVACLVQIGRGLDGAIVQTGDNLSAGMVQTRRGAHAISPELCAFDRPGRFMRAAVRRPAR